jgi:3-oxoisoapionate decarboxylase
MRLGISSYTFVWSVGVPGFPQPRVPLTADGLLAKATELAVRVVQIADNLPLDRLSPVEIDELARRAADLQIDMEVGTCGIDPAHLRTYLALAVKLCSPIVRVVVDTPAWEPSPDDVVASLQAVLPNFSRAGVCLAIENHDRFPAEILAEIVKLCDSRHLGICLDTANSLACGEDLKSVLRVLGPFVVNLHVKDFRVVRLPHKKGLIVEGCPAGKGLVNIPRLLAELRELQRDPNLILELWPPPEATIRRTVAKEEAWARTSVEYLRQFVPE